MLWIGGVMHDAACAWVQARATNVCDERRAMMATPERTGSSSSAGIGLGGILVVVGILLAIFWSVWIGIIVALVGLIAFGGFARGRWY